jgi:O-antigen ligase
MIMMIVFQHTYRNSYQFQIVINRIGSIVNIDNIEKNSIVNGRIIRWNYATNLICDYNIAQILIGNGFIYNKLYGQKFSNSDAEGYPHNIIISQILYSGLFGLFVLMLLYYQIFKIYLKYNKQLKELAIFSLITTFFMLISGNTFFSLKIYLLVIVLGYIYDYLTLKERKQFEKSSINSIK